MNFFPTGKSSDDDRCLKHSNNNLSAFIAEVDNASVASTQSNSSAIWNKKAPVHTKGTDNIAAEPYQADPKPAIRVNNSTASVANNNNTLGGTARENISNVEQTYTAVLAANEEKEQPVQVSVYIENIGTLLLSLVYCPLLF